MSKFTLLPTIPPPPSPFFTLYAGNLHHRLTEHDLYTVFSTIGPVYNIHLFRHPVTLKSLSYAFIDFHFPYYAAVALCGLNYMEVRGKPMRLMWVQRDPVLRKSGVGNLFVKNLDLLVTEAELHQVFGVFGVILSCKVARDDYGKSKGFGFVQFCSEDSALYAISEMNGSSLHGKILTVEKFLKKSERKEPQFTNLYVKNLDQDFTLSSLKETFSKYGKITSAVIMSDAEGKSKGFGFVNFESHENAVKAIEGLNGAEIGTKKWFVGKAMMKSQRAEFLRRSHIKQKLNMSNLFVNNIATFVTENDLKQVFGAFGNVTFAKVVCYRNGVSRGMAYICFSKPEEAKKAIAFLNGCFYNGKYMSVSFALHKEARAKHLQPLSALQYTSRFVYKVPNLQKEEKKVQKEDPANEASSCNVEAHGFVLVDKSTSSSERSVKISLGLVV